MSEPLSCPACRAPVTLSNSDEGTCCYVPQGPAEEPLAPSRLWCELCGASEARQREFPILHVEGRCGGAAMVGESRITVWGIVAYLGVDPDITLAEYYEDQAHWPAGTIESALLYYARHPEEIDTEIRENAEAHQEGLRRQEARRG